MNYVWMNMRTESHVLLFGTFWDIPSQLQIVHLAAKATKTPASNAINDDDYS